MVNLPSKPRRAWLISFWLVITLLGGPTIGATLSLLVSGPSFVVGIILGLIMMVPGILWPKIIIGPYRVWRKITDFYMRAARVVIKAVCFYVIVGGVGWVGSSLRLVRPGAGESLWIPRTKFARTVCVSQHVEGKHDHAHRGWVCAYLLWAAESWNIVAACLLPFLMLLAKLEVDQESDISTQTYTLF